MEINKQQLKDQMRSETQDLVRQVRLIIHQAYSAGYGAGMVRGSSLPSLEPAALAPQPSTTETKDNGK